MKLLYISHTDGDCFIVNTPSVDLTAIVDKRSLVDIFEDDSLSLDVYDIIFVHPNIPADPGWKAAPGPTIIFSGGFRKPLLRDVVVHIPKEMVEKHWKFLIDEYMVSRSFTKTLLKLQHREKVTL